MVNSRSDTSTESSWSNSSMSVAGLISSSYTIIDSTSRPSRGRMTATYCLARMTKRATATLPAFSMASTSSAYGLAARSSGATQ